MVSTPETERRALTLFQEALDVPAPQRPAWLDDRCRDDDSLRVRVEAMLAADRLAALHTGAAARDLGEESVPDTIGAYRITGVIGRGGMGTVYRAERSAGDFARTVAIKRIKPGLLSEPLVERFQRERQTLARLEHAHIARLYDGGAMPDGAPYLVMEYVDGEPLLDWAEARTLDTPARLDLLADICAAVAYAHRNLVVHRDITPSNVLVTETGVVKLIDFGIARPAEDAAPQGEATSASLAALSLTPGYAAPERLEGGAATTLGDVFSLGKLLAALLPTRDVELEAIVHRASAARPEERYATVDALAADVAAYRADRPVTAMGRERRYLWRKFYARNRGPVLAAAGALALLLVAFGGTIWALGQARASQRAEAARFEQVRSLGRFMVFDLNGRLANTAGNTEARAIIAAEAQGYLSADWPRRRAHRPS